LKSGLAAMEKGSRDLPSTGYKQIDQYLGLPLETERAPIPMVLGPGGTGKTTGSLVASVRRLLRAYDSRYMDSRQDFKTPDIHLDQVQQESVESIQKLVQ